MVDPTLAEESERVCAPVRVSANNSYIVAGRPSSSRQSSFQHAKLTLAYMPSADEVTTLLQSGEIPAKQQAAAIEAAISRCSQIHAVQVATVRSFSLAQQQPSQ